MQAAESYTCKEKKEERFAGHGNSFLYSSNNLNIVLKLLKRNFVFSNVGFKTIAEVFITV